MRLPDLHRRLLSDALDSGHAYRLVLAGGYAVQAHELVSRTSQDLDLATRRRTSTAGPLRCRSRHRPARPVTMNRSDFSVNRSDFSAAPL